MLFASICLAFTGGKGGLISTSTQPPYTLVLWGLLGLATLIFVLWLLDKGEPVSWDEEDEDDQFYDDH